MTNRVPSLFHPCSLLQIIDSENEALLAALTKTLDDIPEDDVGLAAFPALDGGDTPSCTSISPAPSSTPPSPSLESPPARAPEVDELSLVRTYFQSKRWWWPGVWCLVVGLVGFGKLTVAPVEVSMHQGQWGSQKTVWVGGFPGPHLYHPYSWASHRVFTHICRPLEISWIDLGLQNLEITCKHFPKKLYIHTQ